MMMVIVSALCVFGRLDRVMRDGKLLVLTEQEEENDERRIGCQSARTQSVFVFRLTVCPSGWLRSERGDKFTRMWLLTGVIVREVIAIWDCHDDRSEKQKCIIGALGNDLMEGMIVSLIESIYSLL